ncbi:transposase [Lachnotalea glycerini]|uniref:Transposase n=1 Tax=Lachnotalea glycerini TaxID=1763509 RepID=A0A318EUU2_9FIRM|nr:IS110 family transposase [Lachnotalea glycerini]PXV93709.1 transposase [Lachnotalea glycerini]
MKEKIDYLSTLFVGIDIASRIHVISALDFNQDFFIKMKSIENAQEGATLLERLIVDVLNANHQFKFVVIGMESTGFYGVHLANYLSASELLAPFSVRVYCLNPKEVKNYKKFFNDIGKNNGIDSFVIADFARVGRISTKPWRGFQYLALQRLTRHRSTSLNVLPERKHTC